MWGILGDMVADDYAQPLQTISRLQNGSVETYTGSFIWTEQDAGYRGTLSENGLIFARRYHSRLEFDGVGSTGVRWVSSITERIHEEISEGQRALRHFDWTHPFNDPDLYYLEDVPGSGVFVAPPIVGGSITVDEAGGVVNSYTLTQKTGDVHVFDGEGRIAQRRDPFGNTVDFVYSDEADPVEPGLTAMAAPAPGGPTITITDTRGAVYTVTLDSAGYITSITDPMGYVVSYSYTAVGSNKYLTTVTFPARQVYESDGSIPTRTTKRTYTYGTGGRLEEIRDDANRLVLQNAYDPVDLHRVVTQTDGRGGVHSFTWNGTGDQLDVIDPRGFKRRYYHNIDGQVVEVRLFVANFAGGPARSTDTSLHHRWQLVRQGLGGCGDCGPIRRIIEPDGGEVEIVYDAAFNVLEVRKMGNPPNQADWLVWKWTYDSKHRVETHIPPEGNASSTPSLYTTTFDYQEDPGTGQLTAITETIPARHWRTSDTVWTRTYDSRGRMLQETGTAHGSTGSSFYGRWEYYPGTGGSAWMPKNAYVQDPATVTYTYEWNANGWLTNVTGSNGLDYTATYDSQGRPLTWTAPDVGGQQHHHEWAYDGEGRLARLRWRYFPNPPASTNAGSWQWIEWHYTYDVMGNLVELRKDLDAAGDEAIYLYEYDAANNLDRSTDPDGQVGEILSDERDLPWLLSLAVGTPEAVLRRFDYNDDGRIATIVDELDAGRQVRFIHEYDKFDLLWKYRVVEDEVPTNESGYVEILYDDGARISDFKVFGKKAAGGHVLVKHQEFTYDDWHRSPTSQVTKVYEAESGLFVRQVLSGFAYGSTGLPIQEKTGGIVIANYEYTSWGAPWKVGDQHGNGYEIAYDAFGHAINQKTTHDDPVNGATLVTERDFVRDAFGRATSIVVKGAGVPNQMHQYGYDSADNVVEYTAPDGNVHRYEYRFDGRQTRQEVAVAGGVQRVAQFTYTDAGALQSVIDDRNNTVSYIYDGRGRVVQEVHPDGSTWTNEYNLGGLLEKIIAPSGRSVSMAYDWRGMLSSATVKDPQGNALRTDTFEVDPAGNIGKVTKVEGGTTSWADLSHDGMGLVLSERVGGTGMPTTTVSYGRDGLGRLTSITGPSGVQHVYAYDDRHRVKTLTAIENGASVGVATYDYVGAMGAVARRAHGNGTTMTVARDGFGRVSGITTAGPVTVSDLAYAYDARGFVAHEHRLHDALADVFWYDGMGRLTAMTRDSDDPVAERATPQSTTHAYYREYLLDGDYHRSKVRTTPMGGSATDVDYTTAPQRHHYTAIQEAGQAAVSRTFDIDGRVTTHGARTFGYDSLDNLASVTDAGVGTATYTYDALDRRWTKTTGGVTTRFVYAGPWILEEYETSSGGTESRMAVHFHGPGVDEVVMSRRCDISDIDGDQDTTECVDLYLHHNRIGSVTEVTDSSGAVVESYRYAAYGVPTVRDALGSVIPQSAVGNAFLFTGREYDAETGLYHYRARAYDPATGSFLQEDPLGLTAGFNLVAYVWANPVSYVDPYGYSGIGTIIQDIIDFVDNNRATIADVALDLLTPLQGILDLMSSVTGKDITGWLRGGGQGTPASLGWWDRAVYAVRGAATLAVGALAILGKLEKILNALKEAATGAANRAAGAARRIASKLKGGCFVLGTLVLVEAGLEVPIEDIEPGQTVAAEIPSAVPGRDGQDVVGAVRDTSARSYSGALHTLVLESTDGRRAEVTGTPEHPFWCMDLHRWLPMAEVGVGRVLDGLEGPVTVVARDVAFGTATVWNLTVPGAHTYRVSGLGVLVHNSCPKKVVEQIAEATGDSYAEVRSKVGKFRFDNDLDGNTITFRNGRVSGRRAPSPQEPDGATVTRDYSTLEPGGY